VAVSPVQGGSDNASAGGGMRAIAPLPAVSREYQYHLDSDNWTPDKVRCAISAAEGGNLESLSDFVETMFSDDRVDGVLGTRTFGLLGLPLTFQGGDVRAVEALSNQEVWETLHSESELSALLTWGITLGVGLAQRIPIPRTYGQPQRYKLEVWSPRWLWYDIQDDVYKVDTTDGPEIVEGDR